jgi:hypothetical protein
MEGRETLSISHDDLNPTENSVGMNYRIHACTGI